MMTTNIPTWKQQTIIVLEVWLAFCIATFSMAVYFSHLDTGIGVIAFGALLIVLYLFVIGACFYKLVKTLPIAVLMILVPIAPLAVLLLVVSLLPIIQQLR